MGQGVGGVGVAYLLSLLNFKVLLLIPSCEDYPLVKCIAISRCIKRVRMHKQYN